MTHAMLADEVEHVVAEHINGDLVAMLAKLDALAAAHGDRPLRHALGLALLTRAARTARLPPLVLRDGRPTLGNFPTALNRDD
jgi:hypothetical protein